MAAGFLGAWIIRRLTARGLDVRVFDRREERGIVRAIAGDMADRVEWRTGDVASGDDVLRAAEGCDFAIHLAALLTPACAENPILGAQVNLIGTLNVFEAAATRPFEGAHAFSLVGEVADISAIAAGIEDLVPGAAIDWAGPPLPLHPVIAPSPIGGGSRRPPAHGAVGRTGPDGGVLPKRRDGVRVTGAG